jgi:hypothetical protein
MSIKKQISMTKLIKKKEVLSIDFGSKAILTGMVAQLKTALAMMMTSHLNLLESFCIIMYLVLFFSPISIYCVSCRISVMASASLSCSSSSTLIFLLIPSRFTETFPSSRLVFSKSRTSVPLSICSLSNT